MADEFDSKGRRLISVVRVLEYHGSSEWITATLESSRIPWQGSAPQKLPEGCFIKSGLVVWSLDPEVIEEPPKKLIPIPPGSTSVM